jgi:anti-sigma B factor antagonist/stage II sporulation protein AA (anti-sigma F factor antagonist)
MILSTREQSGVLVVCVNGRLDHVTSELFNSGLSPLIDRCSQENPPVLLDFSNVDYISSAGLRVLMMASNRAKSQKGAFAIAALKPLVQEIFAISRFTLIMPCYISVETACKVLGK